MTHRLLTSPSCLSLLLLLCLSACGTYDLAVNDKIVYTPLPLFEDYEIADEALRACIERTIASDKVTAASQLSALNCAKAGVVKLDGLSVFTEIERLRLSGNSIDDLGELVSLTLLQELYLDDNSLTEVVPLYQLPALRFVDLAGNDALLCPSPGSLLLLDNAILPAHCN